MFKKIICAVLAIVMVFGIAGCSSASSGTGTSASTAASTAASSTASATSSDTSSVAASAPQYEKKTLVFSYFGPETNTSGLGVQKFKELIEQRSGGQVTVDCYFNGTLFPQDAEFENLIKGNMDFMVTSFNYAMSYIPELSTTFCPYMWKSLEHWQGWWASEYGQALLKRCETEIGVHYISYHAGGYRNVNLNKDIKVTSRDDLKGIKLRSAPAENMMAMTEALGGNPIPIAFSDAYLSIQTGVVDGFEGDPIGMIQNGLTEVTKSVTLTHHYLSFDGIVASQKSWASWSPELQELVTECATEASAYCTKTAQDDDAAAVQQLKDMGIKVYDLTDAEREAYANEVVEYFKNSDFAKNNYDMDLFNEILEVGQNY